MVNKITHLIPVLMIFMLLAVGVNALTANMGNARMVLRANVGETIQKSILVKNINNVTINIDATPGGDLANSTKITNPSFSLLPNEQKNIDFKIKVTKPGTTDTKIFVKFSSAEEKNGVGLASNIIIITGNETYSGNNEDNTDNSGKENNAKINPAIIAIVLTIIVVLVFAITMIFYLKKGSKQEGKINKVKKE